MTQRIEYHVETLGHTLRVVENIDGTGFGDDIALCGDCTEQNQEKAKYLCGLLNDRLAAYDEITRLREQNEELLAALKMLHPRPDVWITPNDEQSKFIESLISNGC